MQSAQLGFLDCQVWRQWQLGVCDIDKNEYLDIFWDFIDKR